MCLNWYVFTNPGEYGFASKGIELIDDGRWDAAFQLTGNRSTGFDIHGTPFGRTPSWYNNDGTLWENLADGMVFYVPFHKFKGSVGISDILDTGCKPEMQRRLEILYSADEMPSNNWEDLCRYYNTVRQFVIPTSGDLKEKMTEQMSKWQEPSR